jgi:hypothetical protein
MGIKKKWRCFKRTDYTLKIINNPDKFGFPLKNSRLISKLALFFYFMIPTYVWILKKDKKE